MPSLERRLSALRGLGRRDAAAILAEAVLGSAPDELGPICRAALVAGRAAGGAVRAEVVASVLRRLHELDDEVRRIVTTFPGLPAGALDRALAGTPEGQRSRVRTNVIAIVAARGEPVLCRGLPALITADRDDGTGEAAAAALLAVTVRMLGPAGRRQPDPTSVAELDAVLAAAAGTYREHRRDEVLIACAIAAERAGPALGAILDDAEHPFAVALRGVAARLDEPLVRRNLLRWMGGDHVARSAVRWLQGLVGTPSFADALHDGHLLIAPQRRGALRQVIRPTRCLPTVGTLAELPARAQLGTVLLIERLDLSAAVRVHRLADLVAAPSAAVRRRAVLALRDRCGRRAAPALASFALDRDPAVSRLALRSSWGNMSHERLERIAAGGHPGLARRARRTLASRDADALRRWWPQLGPADRAAAAARLDADDRAGLVSTLGALLRETRGAEAVAAIVTARRRRLVPEIEDVLLPRAGDDDPRVASAAMAALADGGGGARRHEVLVAGLASGDERVRANAIEALGRTAPHAVLGSTPACDDDDVPRCRANAIRVLLAHEPDRGGAALRRMLAHPEPRQRVSAIWVARVTRHAGAAEALVTLATSDPLAEIRTRADAALRFLGCTPATEPSPDAISGARP